MKGSDDSHSSCSRLTDTAGAAYCSPFEQNADHGWDLASGLMRVVWENTLDAMRLTDQQGRIVRVNAAFCRLMQKSREELEGEPMCAPYLPSLRAHIFEKHGEIFTSRAVMPLLETVVTLWNGEQLHLELSNTFLEHPGRPTLLLSVFRDISSRVRAQQQLRESELRFRTVVENLQAVVFVIDKEGRFELSEGLALKGLGLKPGQVVGMSALELYKDHPEVLSSVRQALAGQCATAVLKLNGIWFDALFTPRYDQEGHLTGLIGLAIDITQKKLAETELMKSRRLLADIIENSGAIIIFKDREGRYELVNRKWEEVTGRSRAAALGKTDSELFSPQNGERTRKTDLEVMASQRVIQQEETFETPKGKRSFISVHFPLMDEHGQPIGVCSMITEITALKQAEADREHLQEQLVQAQKMESVGRLAGGVAHDFNNMLQAIIGNVSLALEDAPQGSLLHECLEEIAKSGKRAADLTRQLLAFARKQTISPKVLDLNETVAGMLKMLRRLIGEDIELAWLPGAELWPVKMDPSQIDQILANLCVNARDAIVGHGCVSIQTSNITFDASTTAIHPECAPGDYVLLSVSDTGHGMDAQTRARLFEPFFTTKPVGKGTGLGLATVFGIVKQNLGFINVFSEPGHGTTLKLYFPRAEAALSHVSLPIARVLRGTETVLLVEDEEQILNLGRRILTQYGYTVLSSSTPHKALEMAAAQSSSIDLLITDVVMPGMNGKQLYSLLSAQSPGLKCLFMSGYTANVIADHGVLDEGLNFVQKPFTSQTLAEKVREVLEKQADRQPSA